jgi:NADH-quinone oxidoreductase subunit N
MKHELALGLILVILLILKIAGKDESNEKFIIYFNVLMTINCFFGWIYNETGALFDNMFVSNQLIALEKNILNAATLIICFSSHTWLKNNRHLAEFYILMITSLMGMFFMISSSNMLMFYLGLEMSAIPLAALCNFNQEEKRSSEAAMKMIFSSAFSSCILLLGISFIYGVTGSLDFNSIGQVEKSGFLMAGFLFFISGLIFKLSVVPFHLWTADVYEGSPVAVTSFFSVVSKGSVVFVITGLLYNVFGNMQDEWYFIMGVLSVATMIIGNLFALRQENMKRFLAFSSITQVGFILIGITGNISDGITSSVYFILIYVFSNLAAFAIVSRISELTGKETISQYRGLAKTNPVMSWSMAIALFSLAGIPPTAGFFGKIFLLTAGASRDNYLLITIAALNMIISLYYYLRVIRAMFMDTQNELIPFIKTGTSYKVAMFICIGGILITGFIGSVYQYIHNLGAGL